MQLDKLLISVILVSVSVLAVSSLFLEAANNYGVTVEDRYSAPLNKMNASLQLGEKISDDIKGSAIKSGSTEAFWESGIFLTALNVLKYVFVDSVTIIFSIFTALGTMLPIPGYMLAAANAVTAIVLVFSLVYMYLRFKG